MPIPSSRQYGSIKQREDIPREPLLQKNYNRTNPLYDPNRSPGANYIWDNKLRKWVLGSTRPGIARRYREEPQPLLNKPYADQTRPEPYRQMTYRPLLSNYPRPVQPSVSAQPKVKYNRRGRPALYSRGV